MKQKTSFYFILYLVAIVSLLDVITERDEAQQEMVDVLVKKITSAPVLSARDTVVWTARDSGRAKISVAGLSNPLEIASIRYMIASLDPATPEGIAENPMIDSEGNAILTGKINQKGTYNFLASATVEREIPADIPEAVRDAIRRLSGDVVPLETAPVHLVVRVDGRNTVGPGLTLNVEPPGEDKWILGAQYTKNIYVGGPPPDMVKFTWSDSRFALRRDVGKIQLIWVTPVSGVTRVVVHADANRELGELDHAQASFTVEVAPPRWQPEPRRIAYNRVAYQFESVLGGLPPNDYAIQVLANGTEVKATVKPNELPYEVVPDQSWKTMTFRAVGHATTLKEIQIPVKDPPPPQIRWQGESHEGNDHIIKFYCEDVNGGDVNINFNVVQPQGVKVIMSPPVRGKSFSIAIKDVASIKRNQVELAVTALGIGGPSKTPVRTVIIK